ncbi:MAG: hypothetical protein P8J29_05775 [Rhodospirillales bacterium]|nr:hypothetical protein [Rhodospirillales bacterium]
MFQKNFNLNPFIFRLLVAALITAVVGSGLFLLFITATNESQVFSDKVIKTDEPLLWGPAFGQQHATYKLARSIYLKPEIIVLGSSRVTQFRDYMAPGNLKIYNASLAASSLSGAYRYVTSLIPKHRPKLILLGIDPWWFDPVFDKKHHPPLSTKFNIRPLISNTINAALDIKVLRTLMADEINRDFDVLGGRKPVGYNASSQSRGFRPDGSYQYGSILLANPLTPNIMGMGYKANFKFYINETKMFRGRMKYVGEVSRKQVDLLTKIINFTRSNDVNIILFFPPMASALFSTVQDLPKQRKYFDNIRKTVKRTARVTETEFYDFHNLGNLGIYDRHTLDALHVDEIATLAVLDAMVTKSKVLGQFYGDNDKKRLAAVLSEKDKWVGPHRVVP